MANAIHLVYTCLNLHTRVPVYTLRRNGSSTRAARLLKTNMSCGRTWCAPRMVTAAELGSGTLRSV